MTISKSFFTPFSLEQQFHEELPPKLITEIHDYIIERFNETEEYQTISNEDFQHEFELLMSPESELSEKAQALANAILITTSTEHNAFLEKIKEIITRDDIENYPTFLKKPLDSSFFDNHKTIDLLKAEVITLDDIENYPTLFESPSFFSRRKGFLLLKTRVTTLDGIDNYPTLLKIPLTHSFFNGYTAVDLLKAEVITLDDIKNHPTLFETPPGSSFFNRYQEIELLKAEVITLDDIENYPLFFRRR